MYAVIRAGGKQYRVEEGETLSIPGVTAEAGKQIELDVLAFADDGGVRVGSPTVDGVRVTAEVVRAERGPKIDVLRYKSKVRHRKARGHRQGLAVLRVTKISAS